MMYGVVLWCDCRENKAVIWCEDQGDLAYYRQSETADPLNLDAGDWVQFDVTTGCDMRLAHNPRLVAEGVFGGLADSLKLADGLKGSNAPAAPRATDQCSAEILVFGTDRAHGHAHRFKTG